MRYPEIIYPKEQAFDLDRFREMDYYAVNNFNLPIELMMENAGLQLANLVASFTNKNQKMKKHKHPKEELHRLLFLLLKRCWKKQSALSEKQSDP